MHRPTKWDIEDIREENPGKFALLDSIGAIHPELLCSAANNLEFCDNPHVACFFQLPYPVSVEQVWHRVRYRSTLYADIFVKVGHFRVVWERGLRIERHDNQQSGNDSVPVSYIAALVPLWGRRQQFYDRYLSVSYSTANSIVVPIEKSWIEGRAMTAADYEESLCRRLYEEMNSVLRRLMPSYSVLSLQEAPLSSELSAFYVMPAPGRLVYSKIPQAVVIKLLNGHSSTAGRIVAAADLQKAMTGARRQISEFEHQLLAMNRLYKEGEAALALIGTLSLIEWFVNSRMRVPASRPDFQPSLSYVLRKTNILHFLPHEARDILAKAIDVRDKLVHGSPPMRESLTLSGARPGKEYSPALSYVQTLIEAAFEIYKATNYELARKDHEASKSHGNVSGAIPDIAEK